jgi:hypothetical protein
MCHSQSEELKTFQTKSSKEIIFMTWNNRYPLAQWLSVSLRSCKSPIRIQAVTC